jgi:hypothetical protein
MNPSSSRRSELAGSEALTVEGRLVFYTLVVVLLATRPYATLLGDIVASRTAQSQTGLFERLEKGFRWVNGRVPAAQVLQSTVGDELQGVYECLGDALRAALLTASSPQPTS